MDHFIPQPLPRRCLRRMQSAARVAEGRGRADSPRLHTKAPWKLTLCLQRSLAQRSRARCLHGGLLPGRFGVGRHAGCSHSRPWAAPRSSVPRPGRGSTPTPSPTPPEASAGKFFSLKRRVAVQPDPEFQPSAAQAPQSEPRALLSPRPAAQGHQELHEPQSIESCWRGTTETHGSTRSHRLVPKPASLLPFAVPVAWVNGGSRTLSRTGITGCHHGGDTALAPLCLGWQPCRRHNDSTLRSALTLPPHANSLHRTLKLTLLAWKKGRMGGEKKGKKVLNCKKILPKCRQSGILSCNSQHSTATTQYLSYHNLSSRRAVLLTPVHGSGTATASSIQPCFCFPSAALRSQPTVPPAGWAALKRLSLPGITLASS